MPAPPKKIKKPDEIKGNAGDSNFVQTTIDQITLEVAEEDYGVDKSRMNQKLILGYLAVAFALTAQFYPMPWPDSWALTAVCVAAYAFLSSSMQIMMWYYDMDVAALTKPIPGKDPAGAVLYSEYARFSEFATVVITSRNPALRGKDSHTVRMTESIGKWFDESGVFYPDLFKTQLRAALSDWEKRVTKKRS